MRKKLISIVMILLMVLSAAACGQSPEKDKDGSLAAYDEIIGQLYNEIETGTLSDSELEGAFSLYVGLAHLDTAEMLSAAGYKTEDINGDGTTELMIGMVGENIIFDLYTLSEGKPVLVFEGFARNSYSLMDGGKVYHHGSSSAASSGFGIFNLPAGGTELECEEFWFSEIKPGTETEIGLYHNTTGIWIPEESEELEVTEEEFWSMNTVLMEKIISIELTPFTNYEKATA